MRSENFLFRQMRLLILGLSRLSFYNDLTQTDANCWLFFFHNCFVSATIFNNYSSNFLSIQTSIHFKFDTNKMYR